MSKQLHFAALFDILYLARGSDSVVECHLAKVKVAGPNPVSRSNRKGSPLHKVSDDDRKIAYSSHMRP